MPSNRSRKFPRLNLGKELRLPKILAYLSSGEPSKALVPSPCFLRLDCKSHDSTPLDLALIISLK